MVTSWANKILYIGGCYAPLLTVIVLAKLCNLKLFPLLVTIMTAYSTLIIVLAKFLKNCYDELANPKKEDSKMSLGEKIREQRKKAGLSQEQLAEKLNVSRQAITKWETNKGIPDVSNLIAISDEFGLSLDELIKGDITVKKKIIADSSARKWHILVIIYLVAIVAYIAYFAVCHRILMIGFLVATLFMLFFELRIFMKEKIYRQGKNNKTE